MLTVYEIFLYSRFTDAQHYWWQGIDQPLRRHVPSLDGPDHWFFSLNWSLSHWGTHIALNFSSWGYMKEFLGWALWNDRLSCCLGCLPPVPEWLVGVSVTLCFRSCFLLMLREADCGCLSGSCHPRYRLMELLAPDFHLTQPWLLQVFGRWISRSVCVSMCLFLSLFLSNK